MILEILVWWSIGVVGTSLAVSSMSWMMDDGFWNMPSRGVALALMAAGCLGPMGAAAGVFTGFVALAVKFLDYIGKFFDFSAPLVKRGSLSAIIDAMRNFKFRGAGSKSPKPTAILAETVAAKILSNVDGVSSSMEYFGERLNYSSSGINAGVTVRDKGGKEGYAQPSLTIGGALIEFDDNEAAVLGDALRKAWSIKGQREKAKAEADNQFNALDALTDIFNIGKR